MIKKRSRPGNKAKKPLSFDDDETEREAAEEVKIDKSKKANRVDTTLLHQPVEIVQEENVYSNDYLKQLKDSQKQSNLIAKSTVKIRDEEQVFDIDDAVIVQDAMATEIPEAALIEAAKNARLNKRTNTVQPASIEDEFIALDDKVRHCLRIHSILIN